MAEVSAIIRQINHSTWPKTTPEFKEGIVGYLIKNANSAIKNEEILSSDLFDMINLLELPHTIWLFNNQFTIGIRSVEVIGNKR